METKEVIWFLMDKAFEKNISHKEVEKIFELFFSKEEIKEGIYYACSKALKEIIDEL